MDPDAPDVTYANQGLSDSASPGPMAAKAARHTSPTQEIHLMQRMATGDESALGELYDRWRTVVYAVAVRIIGDERDAEEVLEDTFWQAWRQAPKYDAGRGTVGTWLATIARSRALDRVRAQSRRLPTEPQFGGDADVAVDARQPIELAEERRIIHVAVSELPREQQQVLELAYFQGLSHSEIAERTGEPLGTIKTRMRLALRKLRDRLAILREDTPTVRGAETQ